MTEKIQLTLRDSKAARWTVLLLLAFAMFCSYIFMDILSPIKDLMQSTRGWDSTAFGTMQGSETFLNVFVFFLIFAGIILDKMGVRFTAILSGVVMLVGASLNWYAVTTAFQGSALEAWFNNNLNYIPGFDELGISPFYRGMPASAKFAAVGFMIFGCGVEMAGITVSRGIVKWFKGREMALAMGSEMALARLGVATCMIFSPVFAKLGGHIDVSRSVAFGVILLLIALIMFIVYFFMDKKLDAQTGEAEEKDDPFKISDLGKILLVGGSALRALLFRHLPVPEICGEHVAVQPDLHHGRSRFFLGDQHGDRHPVLHHAGGCRRCVCQQLLANQEHEIRLAGTGCGGAGRILLYGLHAPERGNGVRRVPVACRGHHPDFG